MAFVILGDCQLPSEESTDIAKLIAFSLPRSAKKLYKGLLDYKRCLSGLSKEIFNNAQQSIRKYRSRTSNSSLEVF